MDAYQVKEKFVRVLKGQPLKLPNFMADYGISAEQAREMIGNDPGALEAIFLATQSPSVFKWLHYLPLYERYFDRFRGTSVKMLEIGVFNGGSIAMWREYLGPDATICGIDIDPNCAERVSAPNMVRIGSQADPDFLHKTVEEMGGVDLILDDGSHIAEHQKVSFETLFPLLSPNGLYAVEDMHTAYWPKVYNGGYRRSGSAIEEGKNLVDDMHHWYHEHGFATAAKDMVTGVHFHDSIMFIEKGQQMQPMIAKLGSDEWDVGAV